MKYSYLCCDLTQKPVNAVIVCKPGEAGIVCFTQFKEHAELIASELGGNVVPVEYNANGDPVIPEPARRAIENMNKTRSPPK